MMIRSAFVQNTRHIITRHSSRRPNNNRFTTPIFGSNHIVKNTALFFSATSTEDASSTSNTAPGGGGYPFAEVEKKWQDFWEKDKTFETPIRTSESTKPKKYILDMFPYPSGAGLHVGHPEGYTASDVMARYYRMKGYDVLHPIGWDSFGLPAEQFAIQTGTQPEETTKQNIANFKRQLKMLGFSYDWDKELATTDINFVKWTQWIFLQVSFIYLFSLFIFFIFKKSHNHMHNFFTAVQKRPCISILCICELVSGSWNSIGKRRSHQWIE